ncbi:hypothetical protein OG723_44400 (plasmid) [Streptomyces sp. NBC_01278]|uniref:hypothetical protein n=1 Tax=Streptomyces sp. NBC_01278 TaxID=2903809 RepID=UPI002E36EA49|nr:hypothetical protein [Streptomyces sp. NBC_01278]
MPFHIPAVQQVAAVMEAAAAALGKQFPRHVPGERDGWVLITRNDRPAAAWDLADKIDVDTPEQEAKRRELAGALAAAGFAVTMPADIYMVFFADPPSASAGPRYVVEECPATLSALFGGSFPVVDMHTRTALAWVTDNGEALKLCKRLNDVYEEAKTSGAPLGTVATVEVQRPS